MKINMYKYKIKDNIVEIFLNSNKYGEQMCTINIDDLQLFINSPRRWCLNYLKSRDKFVVINGNGQLLHRVIMDVKDGNIVVDHINGDTLNNTRANLRLCTGKQNSQNLNRPSRNKKLNVLGVYKEGDKYCASIHTRVYTVRSKPYNHVVNAQMFYNYGKAILHDGSGQRLEFNKYTSITPNHIKLDFYISFLHKIFYKDVASNNALKIKGVYYHHAKRIYRARKIINGKQVSIIETKNLDVAKEAYDYFISLLDGYINFDCKVLSETQQQKIREKFKLFIK